jgi:hypothetical protein
MLFPVKDIALPVVAPPWNFIYQRGKVFGVLPEEAL